MNRETSLCLSYGEKKCFDENEICFSRALQKRRHIAQERSRVGRQAQGKGKQFDSCTCV